jgi:hypothetical protein
MARYRGHLLALIACVAIEGCIYYGLVGLGADEQLIVTVEMIWLCATVWITLSIGERFEHK